jgi:hypothetical protein
MLEWELKLLMILILARAILQLSGDYRMIKKKA